MGDVNGVCINILGGTWGGYIDNYVQSMLDLVTRLRYAAAGAVQMKDIEA